MKNIFIRMVMVYAVSFGYLGASQVIDVHLTIDGSKSFRRKAIESSGELDKWGRFYGQQAPPFGRYFSVVSASYEDHLKDDIVFRKNLINKLPYMIRNDQNLDREQRKKYLFPKVISQSFIIQLQDGQACGKKFQHKFYENKDTKKTLTLSYTVEYLQQDKETGAEDTFVPYSQPQLPSHKDYSKDYVVDLLALVSLIFPY